MSFDPEGYDTRQQRIDEIETTLRLLCTIVVLLLVISGMLIKGHFG